MVETIGPVVEGDRGAIRTRFAHVVGGALGGALTGLVAGAAGSGAYALFGAGTIPHGVIAVALPLLLVVLIRDLKTEAATLGLRRQTPQSWRYILPPTWSASLNGFDLGMGWTTRVYFGSTFVAIGIAFASGHPLVGTVVGGAFGLARSTTVALLTVLPGRGSSQTTDRIISVRPLVRIVNALALGQFLVVVVWTMA